MKPSATGDEADLYERIRELVLSARQTVARGVDLVQVHTSFEIGKGFARSNVAYMRSFYLAYSGRAPIVQTASGQSQRKGQTVSGQLLCKKKHEALVEITLPKDANIHAREYQLCLPSKAELQAKLLEWTAEVGV